ncbi:MAG: DUF4358 domain-containing protein [Paenibacillus macerans]|uniref:DUF4358 domain-containing protein n=1 Tax=Paenibacillus TaxID=44249 RepID=UPI0026C7D90B|nr:DUF4358 domain-containing protein [Paenibacillus macerans]MDU7477710.1 DUF4358 domain-containing protein [Paenibacillus macerans]
MNRYMQRTKTFVFGSALLALIVMTGILAGCAEREKGTGNLTAADVGERIEQSVNLESMEQRDMKKLQKLYHISGEEVADFVLYTASSNVEADELLIVRLKDESEAERVMAKIEERIAAQTAKFKNYRPEQYFLLEKHVLKTKGPFILFAVSAGVEQMEQAFDAVTDT